MSNMLSNSAINKYLQCPKEYDYHYNKKFRSPYKSSALLFGDAMDNALNALLEGKKDPMASFNKTWEWNRLHDSTIHNMKENIYLRYADADFDRELLTKEDLDNLEIKMLDLWLEDLHKENPMDGVHPLDLFDDIKKEKAETGLHNLDERKIKFFNYTNWLSLGRKAPFMIDAYKRIIMPRIHNVHAVQKYVKFGNDDGDIIRGYVDLIADYELDDGSIQTMIIDNKTSSIEYKHDAVLTSQQLTIYAIAEEIDYAGFFIVRKQLRKNRTKKCHKCGHDGIKENKRLTTAKTCDKVEADGKTRCHGEWDVVIEPEAIMDIRIDKVREHTKEIVTETIDDVNRAIKAKIFPRNFNACGNWGGCIYKDLCHKGKMGQVIDMNEEKKK